MPMVPSRQAFTVRSQLACLAAVLLAAGCGLSDYERNMAKEQERLEKFDQENKLLGDPVELPAKSAGVSLFFRPPKGVAAKPEPKLFGGILPHYAGTGNFQAVYLTIATDRKWEDFARDALQPFGGAKLADAREVRKETVSGKTLSFLTLHQEIGGRVSYAIYLHRGQGHYAAIIFHTDPAKSSQEEVVRAMDASLKSLAVGSEASDMKGLWTRARGARGR